MKLTLNTPRLRGIFICRNCVRSGAGENSHHTTPTGHTVDSSSTFSCEMRPTSISRIACNSALLIMHTEWRPSTEVRRHQAFFSTRPCGVILWCLPALMNVAECTTSSYVRTLIVRVDASARSAMCSLSFSTMFTTSCPN